MSRFREFLKETSMKLDLPQPEKSRILLEIASDMEDLHAFYREQGLTEEEAAARTTETFALSDEALADLVRVHQSALQRLLGRVSAQACTRWERLLIAFVLCFALAAAGRALLTTRLLAQATGYIWPILAFGAAALAIAAYHSVRLYILRKHAVRGLRRGIHGILGLGAASLVVSFGGSAVELYRATLRGVDDTPRALVFFVDWALGASATLIVGMIVAIVAAVIWFVLVDKVKRIEIAEASWLIE
jgi:hypothetical protein